MSRLSLLQKQHMPRLEEIQHKADDKRLARHQALTQAKSRLKDMHITNEELANQIPQLQSQLKDMQQKLQQALAADDKALAGLVEDDKHIQVPLQAASALSIVMMTMMMCSFTL